VFPDPRSPDPMERDLAASMAEDRVKRSNGGSQRERDLAEWERAKNDAATLQQQLHADFAARRGRGE
jgi:hypothetical protein